MKGCTEYNVYKGAKGAERTVPKVEATWARGNSMGDKTDFLSFLEWSAVCYRNIKGDNY